MSIRQLKLLTIQLRSERGAAWLICFSVLSVFILMHQLRDAAVVLVKPQRAQSEMSRSRVVVSLSSFVGRIRSLNDTLDSLMKQTFKVDDIYVHIPSTIQRVGEGIDRYESLEELALSKYLEVEYRQRVNFRSMNEDYGSPTKIIGSLLMEKDPETIIITVDDDVIYHPQTIEFLYNLSVEYPENVITTRCENIDRKVKGPDVIWYLHEIEGECKGWAMGYTGVAYRAKFFRDQRIFDVKKAPLGCRYHDDVYISGNVRRNGYVILFKKFPVSASPGNPFPPPVLSHTRHPTLSISKENDTKRSDALRRDCIAFFKRFHFRKPHARSMYPRVNISNSRYFLT